MSPYVDAKTGAPAWPWLAPLVRCTGTVQGRAVRCTALDCVVLHKNVPSCVLFVQDEYEDILRACNRASNLHSFSNVLSRKYRPQLTWAIL